MAVTGGFFSNRLWLRSAAKTISRSASRRPTTKWSGWTAATPCGAVAAGGKSARLNVTITLVPASMAAARTWRSSSSGRVNAGIRGS
jgi:hypothetical protein